MKPPATFYAWLAGLAVLALANQLWRETFFKDIYYAGLEGVIRARGGETEPVPLFIAATEILLSLGFAYFVLRQGALSTWKYGLTTGAILGLVAIGVPGIANHAVIDGYTTTAAYAEIGRGLIVGGLTGAVIASVFHKFSKQH